MPERAGGRALHPSRSRAAALWIRAGCAALALLASFSLRALPSEPKEGEELAAARRLFESNLEAIRKRDRNAYLACYLDSPGLARTGPGGVQLGYEPFAKESASGWPDLFEGRDLQLVPVRPGLVYGTYRYRVRYGAAEETGISERLFLKTDRGWRIAVTT